MSKTEATLLLKIKTMGSEALKSLEDNFDTIKTAAIGAFALISAAIYKSVNDYREQEMATNALTQAMVNNGVYSKALKDDYLAQAAAIQKVTLFGDEQVIAAQAAIQSQIGQGKVTKELTLAVADLAQAKKMDLVSAAELVAKTLGSNNNLLARQGVEFDNNTRGAERLAAVTASLNQRFGGQAEAATTGLGAMKQLSNSLSDVAEVFGEKLAPFISMAAQAMKGFAEDSKNTSPIMDGFLYILRITAELGIALGGVMRSLGAEIGIGLATAVETASMALQGEFREALSIAEQGLLAIGEAQQRIESETNAQIAALRGIDSEAKAAQLAKEENDLKQSLLNKKNMKVISSEEDLAKQLENNQKTLDMQAAQNELERAQKSGNDATILAAEIAKQDAILKSNASHDAKMTAQNEKFRLQEKQKDAAAALAKQAALKDSLSIIAGMAGSSNDTLASIGKAAALTQIAIDTPAAISKALASAPPPFNFALAAGVGAAMASQAARVSGIQLAEGGIVKARPGGIQATIGEGGRDEAVIPLENGQIPGSQGGGHTFVFNGPIMGDRRQAQEFAMQVDRELFELRQNGNSVNFESIV